MAQKTCKKCGRTYFSEVSVCPYCRYVDKKALWKETMQTVKAFFKKKK